MTSPRPAQPGDVPIPSQREASPPALPWVVRLARDDAAAVGRLRLWPNVEVAETEQWLWVRGPAVDNTLAGHWWGLPALGRYTWLADGRLQLLGSRIPADKLPDVKWEPIARWVQVILPPAAFPGHIPRGAVLQLTRSVEEAEPDLLLAPLEEWVDFAIKAAELRLRPLRFAARSGQALIWGKPLPPLPGRRFVRHGRVAVPAGFRWTPAVSAEVLAHRLNVGVDAMALWHEDGSFTIMHTEQWVTATRGAVRATANALPALSLSKGHES